MKGMSTTSFPLLPIMLARSGLRRQCHGQLEAINTYRSLSAFLIIKKKQKKTKQIVTSFSFIFVIVWYAAISVVFELQKSCVIFQKNVAQHCDVDKRNEIKVLMVLGVSFWMVSNCVSKQRHFV